MWVGCCKALRLAHSAAGSTCPRMRLRMHGRRVLLSYPVSVMAGWCYATRRCDKAICKKCALWVDLAPDQCFT